ncbi:cytochrome C peroxidase [Saprospiraceae bacterium]|nr:cytochrome C peroxidase [Saprospiraceae bacterium]
MALTQLFSRKYSLVIAVFCFALLISSCQGDLEDIPYSPTSYEVEGTESLGPIPIPSDNPITVQGLTLGQHLFYDPILSSDLTMSCASCHLPEKGFTDGLKTSVGIQGISGTRSSMSLVNAAYYTKGLFWDGRSENLEAQALLPVEDEIELHDNWSNVEVKLQDHEAYPKMFREAFGIASSDEITRNLAVKALAQFERAIISGNSKYDRWKRGQAAFTDEELLGFDTFFDTSPLVKDGECGHCHNPPLFTTNEYFDNGIQDAPTINDYMDIGLAQVSGEDRDYGKMRAPTLRNIALTAPYMHDGRFATLEEVVDHYDSGGFVTPNRNELVFELQLTDEQKVALVAFMHTLTDTSYLDNPLLVNPFE